ncbi:lipopolysaccharide heptosyltransferase II [Candidatus Syntrophosphaera thermopropionivorans]|uniref:Lipopolysaccharide heptosyltransferase II n=1 Tax=Candidatus Syntrophosphaera thermopropionivorans TaxID=2593015 RepID=A0AC61QJF6_9BACT|nr:lipopolysaccharide heptosyltransferase II [Candidatus Syntrophosphaera thermopropionivorans]TDF73179.1 lipopolysaccharide heptosyltransferase II [Candidatus Syntrophosphaera thermopropionivorans]
MKEIKRIFFIQTAFFGDVIMSTPIPRALKQLYPEAKVDIILIPETRIIYQDNPYVDNIYLFDKRNLLKRIPSFIKLVHTLRKNNYDLAISVHISFSSSLLMLFSGAKIRLGYPRQKFKNLTIDLPKGVPVVKRGLLLLKALSDQEFDYQTELFIRPEIQKKVQEYIHSNKLTPEKMIAIAPGSVWPTKRWLPDYYAEIVKALTVEGYQCVMIGSGEESQLCQEIIEKAGVQAFNSAGNFNILGSAELISNCRLIITNDSAPMHLANAVKTPVLAIFGPTVQRFGCFPYREGDRVVQVDLKCRPCGKHGHKRCPEGHFRCMKDITPEMVLQYAKEMLQSEVKEIQ